jgi:hypothetical protein
MKRSLIVALAVLAVTAATGCATIVGLYAVLQPFGPPMVEARFPLAGKRVVLLVSPTQQLLWSHPDDMTRLAAELWREMDQNVEEIRLVELALVRDLQDRREDFDSMTRADVGKHFKADYVLEIEVTEYTLMKSDVDMILRGHIFGAIRVADVADRGKVAFTDLLDHTYPKGQPELLGETELATFTRRFLKRVGKQIAWRFHDHPVRDAREEK